jgi:hypothetical protein
MTKPRSMGLVARAFCSSLLSTLSNGPPVLVPDEETEGHIGTDRIIHCPRSDTVEHCPADRILNIDKVNWTTVAAGLLT